MDYCSLLNFKIDQLSQFVIATFLLCKSEVVLCQFRALAIVETAISEDANWSICRWLVVVFEGAGVNISLDPNLLFRTTLIQMHFGYASPLIKDLQKSSHSLFHHKHIYSL